MTGLARASLLHYESLGLLKPQGRSASGYRLYGRVELERLQTIRRFREAGLSLKTIRELLTPRTGGTSESAQLLEQRLMEVSKEMDALRAQQKQLARLLATPGFRNGRFAGTKAAWVAMLSRAGMSAAEMHEWHRAFEADSPREHAIFLRSLGLSAAEVASIRQWSKRGPDNAQR
jgi:DNA-binding transcriptional MerR regulator